MDETIQPKSERKKITKLTFFLIFFISLIVAMFGALITGFALNEIYFLKPTKNAEEVSISIPEGSTLRNINDVLLQNKLISSPLLFELYVRSRNLETSFRAGNFTILRGTNMRRIANMLTANAAEAEKTITIIEGWTLAQIADYLETQGISKNEFLTITGESPNVNFRGRPSFDLSNEYDFLRDKPQDASLEGYLFPDTYRVFETASAREVLDKILMNFNNKTIEVRRGAQTRNFYDTLIMASIIEREVRGDDDRRIVSDILWRRLDIGMPLQVDSSVNFLTGRNTPSLSYDDRELDHPYNTYKYRSLPPGPISNPSLSSIHAATNPLQNDYWFFLTDNEGNVHYGRTLTEHNANKARYLSF